MNQRKEDKRYIIKVCTTKLYNSFRCNVTGKTKNLNSDSNVNIIIIH